MNNNIKVIMWESFNFPFNQFGPIDQEEDDEMILMNSPFGSFRIDDRMNPFRRFEFWMGHTNFDIDMDVKDRLETVPGVEVLVIQTRYRFIVAPAKAFQWRDVKMAIERELCGMHRISAMIEAIQNPDIKESVQYALTDIRDYQHWALYVMPNGSIEKIYSNKMNGQYIQKRTLLEEAYAVSNGVLITSEDEYEPNPSQLR